MDGARELRRESRQRENGPTIQRHRGKPFQWLAKLLGHVLETRHECGRSRAVWLRTAPVVELSGLLTLNESVAVPYLPLYAETVTVPELSDALTIASARP